MHKHHNDNWTTTIVGYILATPPPLRPPHRNPDWLRLILLSLSHCPSFFGKSSPFPTMDDGKGGRRKKGLKKNIKDKLGSGNHKDDQQKAKTQGHGHENKVVQTTKVTTEPEKKSMMEKIKDKLPSHHSHQ
ncbi:water stress-inducible protein Rab21-like [Pyrus ussuriensis x Pyrus communis]|uniref:Water stress-inducible protein Rab21-like n=1 Tax=Pyrus ussuriensis x Pyrus communis TaxID=2448454 RepID=A0A5N5FJ60_9ROSA|nr:water stress-inducible protein Rab21-like [Pyrus ussuriensis x Pyrus communis]